ncbi:peptidoglycan-binding domain-containing protein [Nitratireductor luteus]|uniref:peptidoglycan-binding domain-containing protein n=1 Tax=Nitratireductor luteus TaxID=2976980 RepID=UPI00224039A8|nr:peptidoglycan-binding domain-containing protein [Nitratireductor luteus]
MRRLIFLVAAIVVADTLPVGAQSDDGMKLQRCVWACLARSSGNEDPAYHTCVENVCVARTPPASPRGQSAVPRAEQPDRATVSFVQRRLADLGFDPGPIDGIYGRKTRAAVEAFRASRRLGEASGIDEDLLAVLRSE